MQLVRHGLERAERVKYRRMLVYISLLTDFLQLAQVAVDLTSLFRSSNSLQSHYLLHLPHL